MKYALVLSLVFNLFYVFNLHKESEQQAIFKDPVTDDGVKNSAVGRVAVHRNNSIGALEIYDNGRAADSSTHSGNLLTPLFENGKLLKETTLAEIRNKLK